MANHNVRGWGRLLYAFGYSMKGLKACFEAEEAFRQELLLFLFLAPLALWLGETPVERVLLLGCLLIVLIVELLYCTGCRVSELALASLRDLDLKECTLRVVGKGNKQRLVFLGAKAVQRLREYLKRRKTLGISEAGGREALLLNRRGGRLSVRGIQTIVDRLMRQSRLEKPASPHTFRHSYATHVLRRGADIRVVQELLGHASLSTTQVYTHLDIERLRTVYGSAHPHARLGAAHSEGAEGEAALRTDAASPGEMPGGRGEVIDTQERMDE